MSNQSSHGLGRAPNGCIPTKIIHLMHYSLKTYSLLFLFFSYVRMIELYTILLITASFIAFFILASDAEDHTKFDLSR